MNRASIGLRLFAAMVEESEAQVDQHQEAQPTEEGNPSQAESPLGDDDGLYIPSYLEEVAPDDPVSPGEACPRDASPREGNSEMLPM